MTDVRAADPLHPGSLLGLRHANLERVLDALPGDTELSQADLARATGLSPATVSALVLQLVEAERVSVRTGVTNGRRGNLIRRRSAGRRVGVGIDLARSSARVVIGDDRGEVLGREIFALDGRLPDNPDVVTDLLDTITAASARAGIQPTELAAVAASVYRPLDSATRPVGATPDSRSDRELQRILSERLAIPVVVGDVANYGALLLADRFGSTNGLLFVKVGSAISAGYVVDSHLIRGNSGTFGELGHLTLDPRLATTCSCGRRGCLETLASAEAVRAGLSVAKGRELSLHDAFQLAEAGDSVASAVIAEAGAVMGRAIGWMAMTLNPASIYLDGPFVYASDVFLTAVRAGLASAVWPTVAETTNLEASPFDEWTIAEAALHVGLKTSVV